MLANIKGLVDRLELSQAKAMMPLYEAVSNAVDAIEEHQDGFSNHSIRIRLVASNDLAHQAGDGTLVVDGFDVIDDGVGFNDKNLASFQEAHTLSKVKVGGRGVGRFTFLKVFSSVHIRSVFKRDGKALLREFDFSIQDELKGADTTSEVKEACGTHTSLRGMNEKFRAGWPTQPETIAERIIAHFLIRFAARSCPPMTLESPGHAPIDLHALFQSTVLAHIQEQFFEVSGHTFALQAYRHRDGRSRHELNLCANGREVTTSKLRDLLPELPEKLIDEDQAPYTLIVLVTGEYLDDHANQERTRIAFQSDEEPELEQTLVSRRALNLGVADALRPLLLDDLKSTNEEKRAQIEKFVEQAPEYRALIFDNRLIFGDNLLALKALEQEFSGKVKCAYIDPPYNTGSAFEYYDDGLEHSIWLGLMRDRLELLQRLLTINGSIWISIDDNEYPYLRVLCDEIFGRSNFVTTIIWEKRKSRENRRAFSFKHDYIVVYAKDKGAFESVRNPVPMNQDVLDRYRNPDHDPRGPWQSVAITAQSGHATASQFYQIVTPGGRAIDPPAGNCWRFTEHRLKELIADNRIYFGPNGNNVPRQKKFLKESEDAGLTLTCPPPAVPS